MSEYDAAISVRIDRKMKDRLEEIARHERRKLGDFVRLLIAERVEKSAKPKRQLAGSK